MYSYILGKMCDKKAAARIYAPRKPDGGFRANKTARLCYVTIHVARFIPFYFTSLKDAVKRIIF